MPRKISMTASNFSGFITLNRDDLRSDGMTPVYITFTLYLILVLGIGFAAYFATRNFDDYIFTILSQVQAPVDQQTGKATFRCLATYQGNLLTYSFVVNNTKRQEYIINKYSLI